MSEEATLPLVLLPGIDGTGELLTPVAAELSRSRAVHVIAFPSDQPLGYAELLPYVAQRAPAGRFVVVAESFSGPLAIEWAAGEPRIAGLVLASTFARHPLPSVLARLADVIDLKRTPRSLVLAVLLGATGSPELRRKVLELRSRLPRTVLRTRVREVLKVDKRSSLRAIGCPILVLHGRRDWLVWRHLVREVEAGASQAQVRWIDAPHMLLETDAAAAAVLIETFAQELERETGESVA